MLRGSQRCRIQDGSCGIESGFRKPFYRKTKKGHYAVFGPTLDGRYLTIIFELKPKGVARPITGWDMSRAELRYYKKQRK